jgi:hypothetical protein
MDYNEIVQKQKDFCQKWEAGFCESPLDLKVEISENVKGGVLPINGLIHYSEVDTSGWYIWAGEELSKDKDFFKPLHLLHLENWIPDMYKYLGLPPGWRFVIADGYEDIWFDEELLK